jgi:hypothetical protein
MATGGSILGVSVNNRRFPVAADADSNRDLGGFTSESQPNGDGTRRRVKTRKVWMVDGVQLEIDNLRQDLEFLQAVQDGEDDVPIVFEYIDGTSYAALGNVEGDLKAASQNATGTLSFTGPGTLKQQ